jgi:hypothetical protein
MIWTFLDEHGLSWDQVGVMEIAEFAAWARRPSRNVVVLANEAARRAPRTVNRMLTGVVGLYELQARRGSVANNLIVRTRGGGSPPLRVHGALTKPVIQSPSLTASKQNGQRISIGAPACHAT